MKIVFISNYFSHHQRPVSDALNRKSDYTFLATREIPEERIRLGWGQDGEEPDYVLHLREENEAACRRLLMEADVVIAGSAPEELLRERIRAGKLVLRYSERPLKHGPEPVKALPRFIKWHLRNPARKPIRLLCAGGYAAGDYQRYGLFRGKSYQWGYFPPTRRYESLSGLMERKDPRQILWCGRFLDWKHPDDALRVAAELKRRGESFRLDLIGTGPMEDALRALAAGEGLEENVRFLGQMPPEAVRDHMEQAGIFLICSDRQEGWGAVMNEAMNSGCAVVASHAVGAAPFLLKPGENGLIYRSGDLSALTDRIEALLRDPERQRELGEKAYRTIVGQWNAETAADRLLRLSDALLRGEEAQVLYTEGPCSAAPPITDRWIEASDEYF